MTEQTQDRREPATAGRDPQRTAVLTIALLATVAVIGAVLAGVFFWRASAASGDTLPLSSSRLVYEDGDNRAYLDNAETEEVAAATAEIVELLYSYDYTDVDGHADRVRPLVNDEMFDEYLANAEVNREVSTQARTVTTAEVIDGGLGVQTLSGDEAVVTAIIDVQGTVDGEPFANMSSPLQMTLNRIDGEWIAVELAQL